MSVLIGAARSDERGKASGGIPGDQTNNEVMIHEWYDDNWEYVLRPKTRKLANALADLMEQACENAMIGYSQSNRLSLFYEATKVDFKIAEITTPCDCDCSSLVAVCCIGAGLDVNPDLYTGNEREALEQTGKFETYTKSEYLRQSGYLLKGDILLRPFFHTAMVLTNGAKTGKKTDEVIGIAYASSKDAALAGVYRATTNVYIRCGAGKQFKALAVLKQGEVCRNYGYYSDLADGARWLYIQRANLVGFINSKYLRKE